MGPVRSRIQIYLGTQEVLHRRDKVINRLKLAAICRVLFLGVSTVV